MTPQPGDHAEPDAAQQGVSADEHRPVALQAVPLRARPTLGHHSMAPSRAARPMGWWHPEELGLALAAEGRSVGRTVGELFPDFAVSPTVHVRSLLCCITLFLEFVSSCKSETSVDHSSRTLLGVASTPIASTPPPAAFVLEPRRSVVLPGRLAKSVGAQCSRADFPDIDATWRPSVNDVQRMEADLYHLNSPIASASRSRSHAGHPLDVNDYHRQYVGIVVGGQHVIYINALHNSDVTSTWQTVPFNICDGGLGAWGCLYDPSNASFEALAINGAG